MGYKIIKFSFYNTMCALKNNKQPSWKNENLPTIFLSSESGLKQILHIWISL